MPATADTAFRLHLTVNGTAVDREVPANRLLIDLLRTDLGLTGTKEGCAIGICGACSVLVDGEVMSACLVPVVSVEGGTVTGIAPGDDQLSAVQDAFDRHGGFQCGICTPGQVIAATALLAEQPDPDEAQVREWMTGNLCRCTGYAGIVASVLAAAGTTAPGDGGS